MNKISGPYSRFNVISLMSLAAAAVGLSVPPAFADRDHNRGQIRVLSSPPDLVSGGDALVQIQLRSQWHARDVRVTLNGRDITRDFQHQTAGVLIGLVTRLRVGHNRVEVFVRHGSGRPVATLGITNHPIGGAVFSGPQQEPFICETQNFMLPDGSTLGEATDAACNAPKNVQYLYMPTTGGALRPYDLSDPPQDVAQTTTSEGTTINYLVRLETGTINRGIYQIAFLHEPGTALPTPLQRTPGWNGNLLYAFGGGCGAAYNQGTTTGGVVNNLEIGNDMLGLGYAQITSSLNVLGNECNDLICAETAMMVKEYFIKRFGLPHHTIGVAGSGASMQQHLLSQNYPGILDGIVPERSFPDTETIFPGSSDCPLLTHYFQNATEQWTEDQKTAVSGFFQFATCTYGWSNYQPRWINPRASSCSTAVPPELLYDPITNPDGARCDYFSNEVNAYGVDPATDFARRALDNVGVQYGLNAFNAGQISFAKFIELNRDIGGFDVDGNLVASRTVADREALRLSYQGGRVNETMGLNEIPILDVRSYVDMNDPTLLPDVHMRFTSFSTRARLTALHRSAENQIIWTTATLGSLLMDITVSTSPLRQVMREAIPTMVVWLDNIDNDRSHRSRAQKVVRNKPAGLADACFTASMERIVEPATYDGPGQCNMLFPSFGDPRIAAGAPVALDILKCRLKPIDRRDYRQPVTDDQVAQLRVIFPEGVCNYRRPGIEQQLIADTWLSYPTPGEFEPTSESRLTSHREDDDAE
jgi:hypothetical protein